MLHTNTKNMTKNEIKKLLYKQKPSARLIHVSKSGLKYETELEIEGDIKLYFVQFLIPLDDINDATFKVHEQAQLLIRWII